MKYFAIFDTNVARIFQFQLNIKNIPDIFLQYSLLCGLLYTYLYFIHRGENFMGNTILRYFQYSYTNYLLFSDTGCFIATITQYRHVFTGRFVNMFFFVFFFVLMNRSIYFDLLFNKIFFLIAELREMKSLRRKAKNEETERTTR